MERLMITAEYEITFVCKKKVKFETEERNINYLSHMAKRQALEEFKEKESVREITARQIGVKNYNS